MKDYILTNIAFFETYFDIQKYFYTKINLLRLLPIQYDFFLHNYNQLILGLSCIKWDL